MTKKRRVIDKRKKEKFMVDDEYLNGQAKLCGWQGTIVYISLCRHSSKNQDCFPSITLMANENGVSRPTILKGLKNLQKNNVIEIKKEKTKGGKWLNNTYILLDKSVWIYNKIRKNKRGKHLKSNQVNKIDSVNQVNKNTPPSKQHLLGKVNVIDTKETQQGNTLKETHPASSKNDAVNKVFELFYKTINPTINFGNKTSRKACRELIDRFKEAEVIRMTKMICEAQQKGDRFCPVATTPYQMKEKLAQFRIYFNNKKNGKPTYKKI